MREETKNDVVKEEKLAFEKIVVVGYALTSKKISSFLQPKLLTLARSKGISFVAIDQSRPLSDQGPFDILLHKLPGKEWRKALEDFRQMHPEVTVLDPPDAIQHLYNRQHMLQDVADLNFSDAYGTVRAPRQLVIKKDPSSIPEAVSKAGLILPLGSGGRAWRDGQVSTCNPLGHGFKHLETACWCGSLVNTMTYLQSQLQSLWW